MKKLNWTALVLFVLILMGCSTASPAMTPPPTSIPSAIPTDLPPTSTIFDQPTQIPDQTDEPPPTETAPADPPSTVALPTSAPTDTDLPSPTPISEATRILTYEAHGGLCPEGECRIIFTIYDDGSYTGSREDGTEPIGRVDQTLITRLQNEIAQANFAAITAVPFTELCPTAYDGQEVIYTFYLPDGSMTIASCETQIDPEHPLFQAADAIMQVIYQQSFGG